MTPAVLAQASLTRFDAEGWTTDEWMCTFSFSDGHVWTRIKGEMPKEEMLAYFRQLQHSSPRMRRAPALAPPCPAPSWMLWYDPPLWTHSREMQLLERIMVPQGRPLVATFDFPDEVGQLDCDDWEMVSGLLDVLLQSASGDAP